MTKRKAPAAPLQLPSAAVSLPHKGAVLNIQLLGYQLLSSLPPEFQNPEFFDRESGTAKLLQMVCDRHMLSSCVPSCYAAPSHRSC